MTELVQADHQTEVSKPADVDGGLRLPFFDGRALVHLQLEGGAVTHRVAVSQGAFACMLGGDDRLAYHGVDRVKPGTGQLDLSAIPDCVRINLTLRRVTKV